MSMHRLCARSLAAVSARWLSLVLALAMMSATALAADPITVADFNLPSQDANGWTRLAPAADSRLIYVDSQQGNDATGQIYLPGDTEIGSNPQSPRGTVRAFRTIAAAYAQTREDQPDWLLLRAGRVWNERLEIRRGRSASQRAVATSWGTGVRPELRTGTDKAIGNTSLMNVAIIGIRFWAHTRDTDGPHFTGYAGSSGISVSSRTRGDRRQVREVLIEDCVFRSYRNNVITGSVQSSNNEPVVRFVIRRSVISGNYSDGGHAQGLFHSASGQPLQPSILLQENLFDHNGWRIQSREGRNAQADGQATMFNHNTYFERAKGVIFQRNLFLRGSSMGNKWTGDSADPSRALVMEDNVYLEGEIGIGIGGNSRGPARFQDIVIRNNVMTDIGRSRPSNRSLSWGLELVDWKGGEVERNLVIHNRTGITNAVALKTIDSTLFEDVVINHNVFAIETGTNNPVVALVKGANVAFLNNTVVSPSNSRVMRLEGSGFTFSGTNRYVSSANQPFQVDGNTRTLAQWRSATGDQGATGSAPAFPAPQRDLESYAASLGLTDLDGLIEAMHEQSKTNWNRSLTAGVINEWLRAGYGMAPLEGPRRRSTGRAPLAPPSASGSAAPVQPVAAPQAARVAPAPTQASAQPEATAPTDVAPATKPHSGTGLRGLMLRLLPFLAREDDSARQDDAESRRSLP